MAVKFQRAGLFLFSFVYLSECTVIEYGEECNYTAECSDHRYVCVFNESDVKTCICDRFHEWNGADVGCLPKFNVSTILKIAMNTSENTGRLQNEKSTDLIFTAQYIAGLFVYFVVVIASITVSIYCIRIKQKDKKLHTQVQQMMENKNNGKFNEV